MKKLEPGTVKTALRIAGPSMIESACVQLAGLVDTYMVSSLGSNAVAAVGLTGQPKMLTLCIFVAINISVSAIIARRYGQKDQKNANKVLCTALCLVLALVAIMSVLSVVFAPELMRFCGSSENTHDGAVTYFRIITGAMIFNCLQLVINAAQRGIGNTKITMRTNITANVVNIIFNYLLINGNLGFPALGIKGAAIATVLGTVVSCAMSIASICKSDVFINLVYIFKNKIGPSWGSLKRIATFGYSLLIEQLLLRVGYMATPIMVAKLGDAPLAAHQVAMNLLGFSFSFGDGLQNAAVALVGKSLGENNPEMAKQYGTACQRIGFTISLILAAIYFSSARIIMNSFFPDSAEIADIGTKILYIVVVIVLVQICQVIYMGALRGAGDTLFTAIVSTLCVTVIRTCLSYFFAFTLDFGVMGIWLGIFGDQFFRLLFSMPRFKSGKWTKIQI